MMTAAERKERMMALRKEGKTCREIAEQFGLSKQRVHCLLKDVYGVTRDRKHSFDIEGILYEGIYNAFVNDKKLTVPKLAKIIFGTDRSTHTLTEKTRRLIFNYQDVHLTIREIKNLCEYIGEPFEVVFKVRHREKGADDENSQTP